LRYGVLIVVVGLGFSLLMPRIVGIFTRFMNAGEATEVVQGVDGVDNTVVRPNVVLNEQHGDIDFTEFESLTPEIVNEIEEYNMRTRSVTIYSDDVEIVDGKRVEESQQESQE
jgi:hypothetical protein